MARFNRRLALKGLVFGSLGLAGIGGLIRGVLAAGLESRIRRLQGDVRFNGKPLQVGDALSAPLEVVTGDRAFAAFNVGRNAYLVRGNSRMTISGPAETGVAVDVAVGRMLAVFEKGKAQVSTPTAVAGIRGTGIYVEAEAERSYVCLCYGSAELSSTQNTALSESLQTTRHDAPRYISRSGIVPAPVKNHSDDELFLLESLVGRTPPFSPWDGGGYPSS